MAAPFINELPFFRSAYNPPSELTGIETDHSNGITGISKAVVVVLDYRDMVSKYEMFFGQKPILVEDKKGSRTIYRLKNTMIELVKASDFKELQGQLRGKGIGMYGISFNSDQKISEPFLPENLQGLSVVPD